ncbi:MAG: acyl carrier protein [Candidatus Omnitrophota bacterium]
MTAENLKSPEAIIRQYIQENVNLSDLDNDFDIFEAGIVNSLFAIELMTFLEKSFNLKVTMDDLDMANFKSIHATAEFVRRKEEAKRV